MKRRICMIVLLLLSVTLIAQQSPLFYNIGIPKCNDGAYHEVHEYEGFILCYSQLPSLKD